MGNNESRIDSQSYENITFHVNILVCGDYVEENVEKDLENIKVIQEHEGLSYIKKGNHKNINDWKYFFFPKDKDIGKKTRNFIKDSMKIFDYKNLILFYSGLEDFTYEDLLKFYDNESEIYHVNTIIVSKRGEKLVIPELKKLDPNLIRIICEDDTIGQLINIIEITSYCNELGDEIGFPKRFINEKLLEKDSKLVIKDSFTFNILICGKPGAGKSSLINKILGKNKCLSGKGTSSLTSHIVKYIHDKYPIAIYDTPGFKDEDKDIEKVRRLIEEKNKTLNEEKNRIHCVLYCINTMGERTFSNKEFSLMSFILNQKMDIFIVSTHSRTMEYSKDFIEAIKLSLCQNQDRNKEIEKLEERVYPIELKDEGKNKKFGLKEIFMALFEKYKYQKMEEEITKNNLNKITSIFLRDILTKENTKIRLSSLAHRAKFNHKLLASSLGTSINVKGTTMLSTSIIKIISKLYNHPITTGECLEFIVSKKYTNELVANDTGIRRFEKLFSSLFYSNGPAAKEVDYLSNCLIDQYNKEIDIDRIFFKFINNYRKGINEAIDSLKQIKD